MGAMLAKGVEYNDDGSIKRCLFCNIAAGQERQTEVAYEDDTVVVFAPLDKCAQEHWLVVPRKQHIRNAVTLTTADLPLLDYMREVGEKVLRQRSPQASTAAQYVFHVAPFNSIDHLHLHVQQPPFVSWWAGAKYRAGTRWCWDFQAVRERVAKGEPIP